MPYKRRATFDKKLIILAKGTGVVALVLLIAVATVLLVRSGFNKAKVVLQEMPKKVKEAPVKIAMAEIHEPDDARSEIAGKYYGLCKKNSIHSVEDFRKTVQNDPVLSAHYSGFKWDSAKLGKQEKEVWTYVSYRKDEIIRRTSKPVRLPKGDGYITDGFRRVRTFCCNDYDLAPPPVQLSQVSTGDTERVDGPPRRIAKNTETVAGPPRQLASGSPFEESYGSIPETLEKVPSYSFPTYSPPMHTLQKQYSTGRTTVVTPEPGTFYMMGVGVAVYGLSRLLRRKRTLK